MKPKKRHFAARFVRFLDLFIPDDVRANEELHRSVRTFLIGHVIGPSLGIVIAGYLVYADPSAPAIVSSMGVVLFIAYPFALRLTGARRLLSLCSILQFIFLIFYSSYYYGGIASPAMPWAIAVPVVSVFFLDGWRRYLSLAALAGGYAIIGGLYLGGFEFPRLSPIDQWSGFRLLSMLCAAAYATGMSLAYADLYESSVDRLRVVKDQAVRANKAKSEFLANMSHELRTPLNAIIGFSQLIAGERLGPAGQAKYVSYAGDIERSGSHLLAVLNDILDLARIEAGKIDFVEHDLRIDEVIRETLKMLRPMAGCHNVAVTPPEGGVEIRVRADRRMVKQMLANILSNAIKFTPAQGQIRMSTALARDGTLALSVSDTGIGIDPADLERVLQPFEQAETSLSRRYGGVGLGLPLTRKLAELHGGSLTIASVPRSGTTVVLTFPAERVACGSAREAASVPA